MHVCMILDPGACMHVRCIYMFLILILDYDACVYDAHIYVPRSLTMMHVCMMRISMILDLDSEACMHVCIVYVCIVHVSMMRQILSRTNEQGDSRSRITLAEHCHNMTMLCQFYDNVVTML